MSNITTPEVVAWIAKQLEAVRGNTTGRITEFTVNYNGRFAAIGMFDEDNDKVRAGIGIGHTAAAAVSDMNAHAEMRLAELLARRSPTDAECERCKMESNEALKILSTEGGE